MESKALLDMVSLWAHKTMQFVQKGAVSPRFWFEITLISVTALISWFLWRKIRPALVRYLEGECPPLIRLFLEELKDIGGLVLFFLLASIGEGALAWNGMPNTFIDAVGNLVLALAVVRFFARLAPGSLVLKIISFAVWAIALLDIFQLLTPVMQLLDGMAVSFDKTRISALDVFKGILLAAMLLQIVRLLNRVADNSIHKSDLSSSVQALLIKAVHMSLFCIAGFIIISSMGIDLTSLAVVSGAVGVGVGFGLQKVISNYVSGIILLADSSIKPGDTIEVSGVHGVVRAIHGRCTSVLTRSGKEYLVPNENLITNDVINWTFEDELVRMQIPLGVAYDTDLRQAMSLMEEAAKKVKRVLKEPKPGARFVEYGESSLKLELRFWIKDVAGGVVNVKSEVMLVIWDSFKEAGIQFPFPQRDIYIKPGSELKLNSGD